MIGEERCGCQSRRHLLALVDWEKNALHGIFLFSVTDELLYCLAAS
jgi:hypothetical protein